MNLGIAITGIILILLSIPSYSIVPTSITNTMNKLAGSNAPSAMNQQIFSQLGIPSQDTIVKFTQYSFIGLVFAGLGVTIFGIVAKKIPKQAEVRLSIDPQPRLHEEKDANVKAMHLLQERLAKGEITSTQYQSLRKLLEDKT